MNCVEVCPKKLSPNAAIVAIIDLKIARSKEHDADKPAKKYLGIKVN